MNPKMHRQQGYEMAAFKLLTYTLSYCQLQKFDNELLSSSQIKAENKVSLYIRIPEGCLSNLTESLICL